MRYEQFVGPTYNALGYSPDNQITKNWYTEKAEKPGLRGGGFNLLRTPGRRLFCDPGFGNGTVRGEWSRDGHMFAVVNDRVIEVFPNGTLNVFLGTVENDGLPVRMAGNPGQLLIISAKHGYILAGTLTEIGDGFPTGQAVGAAFVDQYFAVGLAGTQFFQISELNDGLTWDPAKKAAAESSADFIAQMGAIGNELWPFGTETIEVFNDTGDLDFPFQSRQDIVIPHGIWAPNSLINVAGTWYMLAGTSGGINMVMRVAPYQALRVSDYGVANMIRLLPRSDDSVGMTYQENDHIFYGMYFPGGDKSFWYDVSNDQWHERTWTDPTTALEHADRNYCMTTAFGKTLAGDRIDGKIYDVSMNYFDDAGQAIHRIRRAPVLDDALRNVVHDNFVLDGNMALGSQLAEIDGHPDVDNPLYDPKGMLKWSNNGGRTFGGEHWRGFGRVGEYERRAIWRGCGMGHRRVYEFSVSAAVDWGISDCYINEDI